MNSIKSTKRPTRKHQLCFNADFRGYTHHCSKLTISERQHGPAAAALRCFDPYQVGNRTHQVACIPTK